MENNRITLKEIFYKFEDIIFDNIKIFMSPDSKCSFSAFSVHYWTTIDAWGAFIRTKRDMYLELKDKFARYEITPNRDLYIYIEEE